MQGPGSAVLCREHQLKQREYGGMGRMDRPHTFHRDWICEECGYTALEDPRLVGVEDEMVKRRIARTLIHGDHNKTRRSDGGNDSKENVKSLCFVCHAVKTTLEEDYMPNNKNI
jgi:5-methylcytosine-specific restriction endonuclease McrA